MPNARSALGLPPLRAAQNSLGAERQLRTRGVGPLVGPSRSLAHASSKQEHGGPEDDENYEVEDEAHLGYHLSVCILPGRDAGCQGQHRRRTPDDGKRQFRENGPSLLADRTMRLV